MAETERMQGVSAPLPAYFRLQEALRKKIEEGHWKPGEAIPSERLISEEYGISIGTVKKAVLNLAGEGYLYRVQGKGTFVGGTTLRKGSIRYYRLMADFGGDMADLEVKLLGIRETGGPEKVNRHLGISAGQRVYELRRLFLSHGKPVVYSVSYLPKRLFKDFDRKSGANLEKGTLYETIERDYGLITIGNHELFGAGAADEKTARALDIPKGSPVLTIEMLSFTYKNVPYEYRRSYCVTSEYRVFAEI